MLDFVILNLATASKVAKVIFFNTLFENKSNVAAGFNPQ